jgi:AraC-like DNA-binding protein
MSQWPRRIEFAQGIMLRTDLTLSQIALRCGLFDQPHLSKMFRSVVGEAPSAWRAHVAILERRASDPIA